MTYEQFQKQEKFDLNQLLAFAHGRLVNNPPKRFEARLPTPPFLMVDRILSVTREGNKGTIIAEQDIRLDAWYFQSHFSGDPVQPGCLCADAVWQLLGFYCVWRGALGTGRALGSNEIVFSGQIRPHNHIARYELSVLRVQELKRTQSTLSVADATIYVDDEAIASIRGARVGVFQGITYSDYPNLSRNAVGGVLQNGVSA